MHGRLAPHEETKQMVESDEMIDMRVGDEDLVDALQLSRGKRGNFTEIEQQAALFEQRLHIDRRVAVASIDQIGMEKRPHRLFSIVTGALRSRWPDGTRPLARAAIGTLSIPII